VFEVSNKIICVDNQQEILDLLKAQLVDRHDCMFALGGEEALSLLQSEGPFATLVADYDMPGMNGVELLQEVRTRSPDTVPMMLTAHDELDVAIAALHEGNIFRFLRKPWDRDHLLKCVGDALEQYRVVVSERLLTRALADANRNLQQKLDQLQNVNKLMEYWVEFSPAIIYSLTIENGAWKPSYVSRNFPRLTGFERTELIANPNFWIEHIHPKDQESFRSEMQEVADDAADAHTCEYRFEHADGKYRWIADSFRVVRDRLGEPLEIVGAWLDVTENIGEA